MRRLIAASLLAGCACCPLSTSFAQTPWALVARRALGRIERLRQDPGGGQTGYEVASVLLDVPADAVFAKITEMARANGTVRVVTLDASQRRIELAQGTRTLSLTVAAPGAQLSQVLIAGNVAPGEDSATSHVVATILRVCRDLHRHCSVGP